MAKLTTVNTDLLPEAFRDALQADLAAQRNATVVDASQWMTLRDAVSVRTKQMRMHGYFPETVLAAIKSSVCDAAILVVEEQFVENVVHDAAQACIAAYFEPEIEQRRIAGTRASAVTVPPGVETPGTIHRNRGRAAYSMTRE